MVEVILEEEAENGTFSIERTLRDLCTIPHYLVWALFDCDRKERREESVENDVTEVNDRTIFTFAAKLGEQKFDLYTPFNFRMGQYLTKFLHEGQGSFELCSSLKQIPTTVAISNLTNNTGSVTLTGHIPQKSWDGERDEEGRWIG